MRRSLSDAEKAEMLRLRKEEKYSYDQLRNHFKCSANTVASVLVPKERNVVVPEKAPLRIKQVRSCLCCSRDFVLTGIGNRLCENCLRRGGPAEDVWL